MGILESATSSIMSPITSLVDNLTHLGQSSKNPFGPDFTKGFIITEVENPSQSLALVGSLMPHIPFETGGEQKIQKDFYVGNSEPVIQVLGAREDDIKIHGRIYEKKTTGSARGLAANIRDALDTFRLRGNLLQLELGEWRRYGYLINSHFKMVHLGDIEYELTFALVSARQPKNNYFTTEDTNVPYEINGSLKAQLAGFQTRPLPKTPRSISDLLNSAIGDVAGAVNAVTGLVDNITTQAEDITKSVNRGLGLIKNAQAAISAYKRRVGSLSYTWSNLFPNATRSDRTKMTTWVSSSMYDTTSMRSFLDQLRSKFAALSATVPLMRHLVVQGDSLQRLSVKYYGTADNWSAIYDHNKLSSTVLVVGSVLEIPRV